MQATLKARVASRVSGNCGRRSSGRGGRLALYSGKMSLRKVLEPASKITAIWVGAFWLRVVVNSPHSRLQNPATAPTGNPSDLRVSGGKAW